MPLSFQDCKCEGIYDTRLLQINNAQGGDYETTVFIKISLPTPLHHRIFLFVVFFYFFFLDSWKCSRKPSGQGNCRLLKLRILCFSWSDMSRLNILHWKNLWASKRRLSARLLNLVKSQSTVKENYLLFSKQMEWLRTCYVLSWKSEEESTQDLQLVSSISRNTSIQSGKSTSLGF